MLRCAVFVCVLVALSSVIFSVCHSVSSILFDKIDQKYLTVGLLCSNQYFVESTVASMKIVFFFHFFSLSALLALSTSYHRYSIGFESDF